MSTVLGKTEGKVKQLSQVYDSGKPRVLSINDPTKKFKLGQSREQARAELLKKKQEVYLKDNFSGMYQAKHICGIIHLVSEDPTNSKTDCICQHEERWPKDRHGRSIQPTVCRLGHYWFNHALDFRKDCEECNELEAYVSKEEIKKQTEARKKKYDEEGIPVHDPNRRKIPGFVEKKTEYDLQAKAIVEAINESKEEENKNLQQRIERLEKQITLMEKQKT